MTTNPPTIRALQADDLADVVALDAALSGRSRRDYLERRLHAARREPALHAQLAAVDAQGLAGFLMARLLRGEFGSPRPVLRLETVGVRPALRGHGVGAGLLQALASWGGRHGATAVHSSADWRHTGMLRWFAVNGFALAPHHVVQVAVDAAAARAEAEAALLRDGTRAPQQEVDYGRPDGNDAERFARGRVDVSTMTADDLDAIVRIDRDITGRDRREHIGALLAEALGRAPGEAAVRVSLAARVDGAVVGYLMARADLGDYGRTEPVAVLDTLGVDPGSARRGVGLALLSQLFAHLDALRVEGVETVVAQRDLALLGFLYAAGFAASPRLVFTRSA